MAPKVRTSEVEKVEDLNLSWKHTPTKQEREDLDLILTRFADGTAQDGEGFTKTMKVLGLFDISKLEFDQELFSEVFDLKFAKQTIGDYASWAECSKMYEYKGLDMDKIRGIILATAYHVCKADVTAAQRELMSMMTFFNIRGTNIAAAYMKEVGTSPEAKEKLLSWARDWRIISPKSKSNATVPGVFRTGKAGATQLTLGRIAAALPPWPILSEYFILANKFGKETAREALMRSPVAWPLTQIFEAGVISLQGRLNKAIELMPEGAKMPTIRDIARYAEMSPALSESDMIKVLEACSWPETETGWVIGDRIFEAYGPDDEDIDDSVEKAFKDLRRKSLATRGLKMENVETFPESTD